MAVRRPTTRRSRTLFGLSSKRGTLHRYTIWRWLVAIVFTTTIAALPFTGVLRLDLVAGDGEVLGEVEPLLSAVRVFAFAFLAVNIVIIVASRLLGRWLCGFVCPVGTLNRFSEWMRWRTRKLRLRMLGGIAMYAACLLLSAVAVAFFVSPAALIEASGSVQALVAGTVLLIATGFFSIVHFLGMRFCRDFCPSGVYFAVLGPTSTTGVEFANPENCTECGACTAVCPVDLEPRHILDGPTRDARGFYPDGLTNLANCLRCGDCVAVCEATVVDEETPLRMGVLRQVAGDEEAGR